MYSVHAADTRTTHPDTVHIHVCTGTHGEPVCMYVCVRVPRDIRLILRVPVRLTVHVLVHCTCIQYV